MVQNQEQPVGKITFSILIALSLSHCLNDLLQSVLSASYPLFKDDLGLSFAQIGLITLVYQLSASVFQPITGIIFDKYPVAWSLPIGMSFTMIGLINLAFSDNLYWILLSVFLIGIGSSVLHPEASRITFLASGGKRGLAQSLFQVGGNFGGSLGPLLVALLVAPYGRQHLLIFAFVALAAIAVMYPICKWYKSYLNRMKAQTVSIRKPVHLPLPMDKTAISIGILLILIFSKYIYMASLTSYYTILGAAPFSLLMPHANLVWTIILSFCVGLMLSSAFPAILLYAQELLPTKLGLISGLFFGFAFGVAGVASAVLGNLADKTSIEYVYNICAYMPLLGLVTFFLPNLKKQKI